MAAGGNRTIRRGHGRALDGKTRGATLIEQNGSAKTAGRSLGQGERKRERRRTCARRGADPWRGSRPRALEAHPERTPPQPLTVHSSASSSFSSLLLTSFPASWSVSSLNQLLRKFSSCMALYSDQVFFSLQAAPCLPAFSF